MHDASIFYTLLTSIGPDKSEENQKCYLYRVANQMVQNETIYFIFRYSLQFCIHLPLLLSQLFLLFKIIKALKEITLSIA